MTKTFRPVRQRRGARPQLPRSSSRNREFDLEPEQRRRPKRIFSLRIFILSSVILLVLWGLFIDVQVRPAIVAASQAVALKAASGALNQALQAAVAATPDDRTMLHVEEDKAGDLRMASFDFRTVSQVEALATRESETMLAALDGAVLPLPVSQSVGGALLSIWSPELPVRIRLIGSVRCTIRMDAHTVGINQTVHALYLDLTAQVQAVAPLVSQPVEVASSVPLAYVVLNGDVPGTYVGRQASSQNSVSSKGGLLVLPPAN